MAGKRISGITGEIILKVDKWSAGIKQAQKDAKALESSLKPTKELATSVGKAFTVAGLAIGGSLLAMAKAAADYGDSIDEASKKTGITTQELSKLKFAADQSDTSFEGLSTGLKILSKNLFDAATGGKENQKVFRELGIATKDAHGNVKPLNEVLLDTADVFKKLPDGPEKAALAMKLFGKSGSDLIPLLNEGREGIKKFGDEAERLGLVLDPATAKLGDDFKNAAKESKAALLGLAVSVGTVLLPPLTKLAMAATEVVVKISGFAREFPIVTKVAALLAAALTGAGGVLVGLGGLISIAPRVIVALKSIEMASIATAARITAAFAAVHLFMKLSEINEKGIMRKDERIAQEQVASGVATLERLTMEARVEQQLLGGSTDDLAARMRGLVGALDDTGESTKKTKDEWKELKENFVSSLKPADDLEKKIAGLQKEFGNSAVIKVYGDEIISSVEGQKALGVQVSSTMANLYAEAVAVDRATEAMEANNEITHEAIRRRIELEKWTESNSKEFNEWTNEVDDSKRANLDGVKALGKMGMSIDETSAKLRGMIKAGRSHAEIMAVMGNELYRASDDARLLKRQLDPLTESILRQEAALYKHERRIESVAEAWGGAIREAARDVSRSISDMVVDWDFSAKKFVDIAKNTAKDMLNSFIQGFISPFTDKLAGLASGLGRSLANLAFGGAPAGGGAGGLASGVLGPVGGGLISKIPGLGFLAAGGAAATAGGLAPGIAGLAAMAGTLPSGAAILGLGGAAAGTAGAAAGTGAAAAGTAAGGAGLLAGIGALATNPITIAVAGGLALWYAGVKYRQGADTADRFVERAQDPFNARLSSIVDPVTAERQAGTLSAMEAESALTQVNEEWERFKQRSQEFITNEEGEGGKEQLVVDQAMATLSPLIDQIRADLNRDIANASSTGTAESVVVNAPLTLNITIEGSEITALEVRDIVAPELTNLLETGLRGIRERWTQLLGGESTGTVAPVGI